ncbi:MAG TPA: hypothetical protein VNT51_06970 [Miltoncostaeaceae bacterium]|nr:hypothetical protein [Miltoncostaeaceae bacterium]
MSIGRPRHFLFGWNPNPSPNLDFYDLEADEDPSVWWVAAHNRTGLPLYADALRPGALAALWRHGDEPGVIGVARILSNPWWNDPISGRRADYGRDNVGSYLDALTASAAAGEELVPGYFVDWELHLFQRRGSRPSVPRSCALAPYGRDARRWGAAATGSSPTPSVSMRLAGRQLRAA